MGLISRVSSRTYRKIMQLGTAKWATLILAVGGTGLFVYTQTPQYIEKRVKKLEDNPDYVEYMKTKPDMSLEELKMAKTQRYVEEKRNLSYVMGQVTAQNYLDKTAVGIRKGVPLSSGNTWEQVGKEK